MEQIQQYTYRYPHPAVTTDCVILTFHEDKLKILLIRRGIEPFKGQWALPGGFIRMDESAEEGAVRELKEETGVSGCTIKQFHTFSAPGRDPRERVITIAFYALMKWQQATGADDAEFADWIPVDSLPELAFDHREIIRVAMEAIRRDIFFEPVGFELLNDTFSMPELQRVYEAILGKEFDRRNFAKKMKHLDILEEVKEVVRDLPSVNQNPRKELPLPFLNIDNEKENLKFSNHPPMYAYHQNVPLFEEKNPIPKEKKPRGRKSLFFRLNRKKYDNMKKDDSLEF